MQRLNTSFVPPGYFITFELFSLSRPKGPECDPKKWEKYVYICIYIYIYIYQNNAAPRPHIDTCIMQYIVLTPLPPTPPTSTYQNHPTPPHTEINQVPRRFRKIRGKKTVLDKESININSEYLEKNLSEQGTEVTTNSNTAGRQLLSPLLQ